MCLKGKFYLVAILFLSLGCATVGPNYQELKNDVENEVIASQAYHSEEATWDVNSLKHMKLDVQCAPVLISAHHIRESIYYPAFTVQYGPYIFQRTDVGKRDGKFQLRYTNGQFICNLGLTSSTQFWYYSSDQSLFAFHELDGQVQVTKFSISNSCVGEYSVKFKQKEWVDLIAEWRELPACQMKTNKTIQQ